MIYLDNAATTRMEPGVLNAMLPYFEEYYGNPSASYTFAEKSRDAVEYAREIIADFIGADPEEIIFTSGGTEADNMAIKSFTWKSSDRWVYTSPIEHKAILNSLPYKALKGEVDSNGVLKPSGFYVMPGDLFSLMYANNELGTIQPIKEIAQQCRTEGVYVHTDAVQAFGHIPINVKDLGVNMMSVSAHKMGGPKGIGFLYISSDTPMSPFISGGGQERFMRAGTENVPAIVGFGKAVEIIKPVVQERYDKMKETRDYFEDKMVDEISDIVINAKSVERLPGHSSITIRGIKAEELLEYLNQNEIYASSGSACNTGDEHPSHVLKAIGLTDEEANSTLRFTLNHENTKEEMDRVVKIVKEFVMNKRS